jgi:hypothetical protein
MAGLLGHLSAEDRDLIERGVHPTIDSDFHIREDKEKKVSKEKIKPRTKKWKSDRCHSVPPKSIYDVLHEAEGMGIELPKDVEEWWEYETMKEELGNDKPMP